MAEDPGQPACVRLGGRYRLVEQAGTGGMAVVWRAFDEVLNRRVAVKVLTPQASSDAGLVSRLHAEAQAVAQLSHPHVTAVHDYGQDVGPDGATQPYVVMELVEGTTLHHSLADGQALPWPRAVTIVSQIASALAAAHSHGIVHRDISTSNIMLTRAGVKVLDFGIAALLGEYDTATPDSLLGTPAYVAPERLGPAPPPVTPAVDVYALGIIFYFLLSGDLPWQAATPTGLLEAHLRFEPNALPEIDGLPSEVAELCMRCLAKEPDDRPSAAMLASLLDRSLDLAPEGLPVRRSVPDAEVTSLLARPSNEPPSKPPAAPVPVSQGPGRRRTVRRAAVLGGVAAAAVAAVAMAVDRSPGREQRVSADPPGNPVPPGISAPASRSPSPTPAVTGAPVAAIRTGVGVTTGAGPVIVPTVEPPAGPVATPPTPPGPPVPLLTTVSAVGGTVQMYCEGRDAILQEAIPADGFVVMRVVEGPAREVRAIFTSPTHESDVRVGCAGGKAQPVVREKPKP